MIWLKYAEGYVNVAHVVALVVSPRNPVEGRGLQVWVLKAYTVTSDETIWLKEFQTEEAARQALESLMLQIHNIEEGWPIDVRLLD